MAFDKKAKWTGNPYLDGRAEWQEMFGSYVHQAYVWRIVALLCLLTTLLSVCGNVYQSGQNKVVPYIVEVDRLGQQNAVRRADVASPVPQRIIQSEIARVVTNWRTVTADLDLQRRMVDRLSNFVAGSAQGFLSEWYQANNPYKAARENVLVQVDIKGLPLPVSNNSWRIEWTETVRNHAGTFVSATTYEATMMIEIQPPTTDDLIIKNPVGLWVTELSFSKVLSPGQTEAVDGEGVSR